MSVLANPRLNVTTTSCHEILGISVSPAKPDPEGWKEMLYIIHGEVNT